MASANSTQTSARASQLPLTRQQGIKPYDSAHQTRTSVKLLNIP